MIYRHHHQQQQQRRRRQQQQQQQQQQRRRLGLFIVDLIFTEARPQVIAPSLQLYVNHQHNVRDNRTFLLPLTVQTHKLIKTCKLTEGRLRLKCDGTRAETRFRLLAKGTSPFKSAGASVQSTTGSRGVRISGSNAGYTMFRGSVKGTGYPLDSSVSPSLPLPCHHISTGVYSVRT